MPHAQDAPAESLVGGSNQPAGRPRRRAFAFNPGLDTAIALASMLAFWGVYYLGTRPGSEGVLFAGILLVATVVPAVTVLLLRGNGWGREGWEGLGIHRRRWLVSLAVAAFIGAGSAYQAFSLAQQG